MLLHMSYIFLVIHKKNSVDQATHHAIYSLMQGGVCLLRYESDAAVTGIQ